MSTNAYVSRVLNTSAVRGRRERLNLTMEQAAKLAGFKSRQHWHRVEAGAPGSKSGITLRTLNALAKALHCDAKDLLK